MGERGGVPYTLVEPFRLLGLESRDNVEAVKSLGRILENNMMAVKTLGRVSGHAERL